MGDGAASSVRPRNAPSNASPGSQTVTQHIDPSEQPSATLRLRGVAHSERRGIQWAEDVVDNEGMGRKSSKVCCIYHKPHVPGDSGSEDSSSSESDSDAEPDLSRAQKVGGNNKEGRAEKQNKSTHSRGKGGVRASSPNAYERQPKHMKKSKG